MSRGLFVTGTDTGVGKTLVTAGIVRWLRGRGVDAVPMKPVQTGAELRRGRLIAPDLEFALSAAGIRASSDEMQLMLPYIYEPACSPHLAGRMAHRYPELSRIKDYAYALLQKHRVVVVEGAGGIMVPLDESSTMLDLMRTLAYPVVLVSRLGLGTINQTLLSIHALRTSGIRLTGVVFNRTEPTPPETRYIEEDNPVAVARFGGVTVLGKIRYLDKLSSKTDETWRSFDEDMTGLETIFSELTA